MDSEGGAVLVCWLVVIMLLMMGGCFGWVANDMITMNKGTRNEQEVRR
jgi:hypothetical protein